MPITRGTIDWNLEDREEEAPGPYRGRRRRRLVPIALTAGAFGLVALSASMLFIDMAEPEARPETRLSEAVEAAPVISPPVLSPKAEKIHVARAASTAASSTPARSEPPDASAAVFAGHAEPSEQRWARDVSSAPLLLQDIRAQGASVPVAEVSVAASPEIAPPPAEAAAERTVRIARAVNLRAEPETGARRVARLVAGTPIAVLGCEDGWCQVETGSQHGFVASALLQEPASAKPRRKVARKDPAKQAPKADDEELEGLPGVFPYMIASARGES